MNGVDDSSKKLTSSIGRGLILSQREVDVARCDRVWFFCSRGLVTGDTLSWNWVRAMRWMAKEMATGWWHAGYARLSRVVI